MPHHYGISLGTTTWQVVGVGTRTWTSDMKDKWNCF